jgi:hypothetical protein
VAGHAYVQNPGWRAGASRDLVSGSGSLPLLIATDWRAQMLACRFCLSPLMAHEVARLCFGEAGHD